MIKAKLIIELSGGVPDFIQAEDGTKIWEKGKIYLLPKDYDFSNGYFEKLEDAIKISKKVNKIKEVE